jgi:cell division protein FtsB
MIRLIRQTPWKLVLVSLGLVYVILQFFVGQQSVVAWMELARERGQLEARAAGLTGERMRLEQQVARLSLTKADPDLVEERAFSILGFAGPDDLVVTLPKSQTSAASLR